MWSGVEEGKGSKLHLYNSHYGLIVSVKYTVTTCDGGGGVREMKTKAPAITYTGTQV